jgi:hypothetical protein
VVLGEILLLALGLPVDLVIGDFGLALVLPQTVDACPQAHG